MKRVSKPRARLKEAAIELYRAGYLEVEILDMCEELSSLGTSTEETKRHELERRFGQKLYLGEQWMDLTQSTLNRWLRGARKLDPDLEIWHLVERRKRRPGKYTNWQPYEPVVQVSGYDPIAGVLHSPPNVTRFGRRVPRVPSQEVPEHEPVEESDMVKRQRDFRLFVLKKEFDYSYRDIESVLHGHNSRRPDMERLRYIRKLFDGLPKMSYSTIRRRIESL